MGDRKAGPWSSASAIATHSGDALFNIRRDVAEFGYRPLCDEGPERFQYGIKRRAMPVDKHEDVGLVQRDALSIRLPIQGGKGVKLQEQQALDRRTSNAQFLEPMRRRVQIVHQFEHGIRREQKIDAKAAKLRSDHLMLTL